ncbi:isopeptide-forming domain-containing fimbrial protein [Enterococcus sp. DIV0212c]|uniref:isopeptide-forming domain-containing fimbrial protein n=1 Tax=Enterococcus sp. DIV0212c TaxID=2230867 RepID=UPI001A9B62E0|nr:isopeptide-forming domain-containing fimbrial protein [Enterococcus sp. DIV0212c]MBO1353605.1 isopeptide-forming domain-containing fimbrial protein [Enterococcus sp. DIV0212c]
MKVNKKILFTSVISMVIGIVAFGVLRDSSVIKANDSVNTTDSNSKIISPSISDQFLSDKLLNTKESIDLEAQDRSVKNYAVPFAVLPTPIKESNVASWTALIAAVRDTTIDRINITADFTSGAALPAISRDLVINGNNHVLGFGARYFNIGAAGKLTISDLEYTGTNYLASGSGTLVLTNKISSSDGNSSVLANMNGATVIFDNVDLYFDSTSSTGAVVAKNFSITNQSKVDSNSERFYQITAASNADASFIVDKQSKVLLSSMKGTGTGNHGQPIQSTREVHMTIEGAGTEMKIRGNGKQDLSNTGLINIDANASTINVLNEALLDIYTENTSAINMQSLGGVFNVKNKSLLNIRQTGDNNYVRAAMIRFRLRGNMQFNIEGQSEIKMVKESGTAPGIRMYGGGNSINVSGGSDFTLVSHGSGTPIDPGGDGGNQGILYTDGGATPDSFVVKDEDSSVDIQATNGAAIDAKGLNMSISAGAGAYFVARGQTRTATSGIFNAGNLKAEFDSLKYFDFVNTRPSGGLIFDTSAGSTFQSLHSDISVWVAGANDITGNPMRSFVLADIALTGANFGTIGSGTDSEVTTGFNKDGGMPKYTRLNGNNQNAVIDELRMPTDADKYIWGHIGIPEGKQDSNRDAFTGEVSVAVGVYDENNTLLYTTTGTVVEESVGLGGISVYGDDLRSGIFRLDTQPKADFLKKGQKLEVLEAWRGDKTSGKAHISEAKDLTAPKRTVLDVTPPTPTKLKDTKLNNATKVLSGTGAEVGATVHVYYDTGDKDTGTSLGTSTVGKDGSWTFNLPNYVDKTKELSVYLADDAKQHIAAQITSTAGVKPELYDSIGLIKPPITNTANGNINPYTDLKYHDAVFKGVVKYTVEDILPDKPLMEKTVLSTGGKTTQVGDILTYTLKTTNGKPTTLDAVWNKVTIKDTIPDGLKFDPATAAVTINGTAATETDFTYDADTRLLTVNVGNLKAGASATVTFKTEVQQSAVGKVINNVGTATGFSPRESGEFIEGPDDPNRVHEVFSKAANVNNPGGSIFGILELVSAPKTINFGATKFSPKGTKINNPSYEGGDLVVKDSRAVQETWTLNARLEKELAKVDDPSTYIPRAIRYVHQNDEITLMGASQPIISRKNANSDSYNISGTWSPEGDGFKLKVESGQSVDAGKYEATIVWELVAGPPSANP